MPRVDSSLSGNNGYQRIEARAWLQPDGQKTVCATIFYCPLVNTWWPAASGRTCRTSNLKLFLDDQINIFISDEGRLPLLFTVPVNDRSRVLWRVVHMPFGSGYWWRACLAMTGTVSPQTTYPWATHPYIRMQLQMIKAVIFEALIGKISKRKM